MSKRSFLKPLLLSFLLWSAMGISHAQVAINTTGAAPANSAILDIQSINKGMLIPRMKTTQIAAITNPANGLMIYDTDKKGMSVFNTARGWSILDAIPSGRMFVSETFPDTLYPLSDYDYIGVFDATNSSSFKKCINILLGEWIERLNPILQMQPKLCYTGSSSNKILAIGTVYNSEPCDSCMLVYNLTTDSIYKETIGYIRRFERFTATTDTTNARIFIWGGSDNIDAPETPFRWGFAYYYNTGSKVLMDSTTAPPIRVAHRAVWAGSVNKLLIFGGIAYNVGLVNSLYAYDPAANNWTLLAPCPLSPRKDPIALYDGNDHLIIWGGSDIPGNTNYYDGAVYTISTNSWSMISSVNAPTRLMTKGSWTGSEMLLSCINVDQNAYDYKAYRYNLAANTWTLIPDIPLHLGKTAIVDYDHLWNGSSMLQLARLLGTTNTTALMWSYSPVTNTWTALAGGGLINVIGDRGIQAGDATIFNPNIWGGGDFFRYETTGGTPIYQILTDGKEFHYYKKK